VIRDNYFHNHIDEINHALGLVSIFETNPKTLFRNHASRLKNLGL
jgi:triacylglycerol lipase